MVLICRGNREDMDFFAGKVRGAWTFSGEKREARNFFPGKKKKGVGIGNFWRKK